MSKMSGHDRIRDKAIEIVRLGKGMDPREFLAAIAIAAGKYIAVHWGKHEHRAVIETTLKNMREMLDDDDKPSAATH